MTKKRHTTSYILTALSLVLTAAVIAAALLLPGMIMRKNAEEETGIVTAVPAAYYAGPSDAVVKNASRQLTEEQKCNLIYGEWESDISPAQENECSLTEYELISKNTWPVVSEYQHWYSWTAAAYKAVDTTFRTYTAVFWHVIFTKYDNSESHEYYITESGTLLDAARVRERME